MKTYKATIYASFSMEVEVQANNPEQARELMAQKWSVNDADCDGFEIEDITEAEEI